MARKKGHWQSERCTVCSHPKIGIINFSLAREISPLAVASSTVSGPLRFTITTALISKRITGKSLAAASMRISTNY